MRINRLELIEKVKAMIKAQEEGMVERRTRDLEAMATAEATYLEEHEADWSKFAIAIRAKLRRNKPVTADDIPQGIKHGRYTVETFYPSTFRESDYVPRVGHLVRLLALLESSPDEYVSTSALDRIGAPIKELMRP
jgi:hypothetical protein